MTPAVRAARAVTAVAVLLAGCSAGPPTHAPPSGAPRSTSATPTVTASATPDPPTTQEDTMRIRLEVDGRVAGARLLDTRAARDLAGMLPLTLSIERHGTTEWVAHPPRALDTTGASGGMTPEVGDIAYFAPWGNLALYHAEGGVPSDGLVPLGRLDDDAVALLAGLDEDAAVTITAAP